MWSYSDVSGSYYLLPRHTTYQLEYFLIRQPRESSNMFAFAVSSASGCTTTTKREKMVKIRPCRRNISDIPRPRLPFLSCSILVVCWILPFLRVHFPFSSRLSARNVLFVQTYALYTSSLLNRRGIDNFQNFLLMADLPPMCFSSANICFSILPQC